MAGCTGYVQVLDVSVKKIMEPNIARAEQEYYDIHPE